ncbi:peroxidase 5-like isoform X1 [Nymphaea colorata]|nr:peroxidase 5-like isoform X1 [Nymphaea colorata]
MATYQHFCQCNLSLLRSLALIFCLLIGIVAGVEADHGSSLSVGYYRHSCPSAEVVVQRIVAKAVARNPGMAAGLIRMHFHDCFVRGCDGSVLLDSTTGNKAEKDSLANNPSLRGFEIIDEAKAVLESECPQLVSCADVLAFAARDAVHMTGGFYYSVPAGRRDGRVSKESEVLDNLPLPTSNVDELEEKFAAKGHSLEDMVTLSGAHTLGVSHCSSFSDRLYGFNNSTGAADPSMDPKYVRYLRTKCPDPESSSQDATVALDPVTPNRLDNKYYVNLKYQRGLLTSDQALTERADTARMVNQNVNQGSMWAHKFSAAMVRMGSIDVLTGYEGEIRKSCMVVN